MRPLAIDLFCGLGGWTDGLLAEGYDVVGFDIEQHVYGEHRYPAQLVVQDVLTLHGSQFKTATLIVASPPCQEYSYMAMPWSRARAIAADYRSGKRDVKQLTALFDACFRIQREACEAAGRHIPLVVENVRGAQPWVGRSRWAFGSFHLWGDVPALMPIAKRVAKVPGLDWSGYGKPGYKAKGFNVTANQRVRDDIKNAGGSWFNIAHNKKSGKGCNPVNDTGRKRPDGGAGSWFGSYAEQKTRGTISPGRMHGSKSKDRKFASAMIAKIPLPLSRHIAATYRWTAESHADARAGAVAAKRRVAHPEQSKEAVR